MFCSTEKQKVKLIGMGKESIEYDKINVLKKVGEFD